MCLLIFGIMSNFLNAVYHPNNHLMPLFWAFHVHLLHVPSTLYKVQWQLKKEGVQAEPGSPYVICLHFAIEHLYMCEANI